MAEPRLKRQDFASPADLAAALAEMVAGKLRAGIDARGGAVLAVSGGTTPARFFEALSNEKLDWTKVVVTLVDERFVPPSSERSNEGLLRRNLLCNEARLARFVGLYSDAPSAEQAAGSADAAIALLPKPFDVVVLGMGADGHTASFFPDAQNLEELTDPEVRQRVMAVDTVAGGEPRLTLTLPVIAEARFLALHIEGAAKPPVLDRALGDAQPVLPIRRVIDAAPTPISVYWAPQETRP